MFLKTKPTRTLYGWGRARESEVNWEKLPRAELI
jgi:hypothetical protein